MNEKEFRGVYAAVLCPRSGDGAVDHAALHALISFLRARRVTRFAVNGATGEFCLTSPAELREVLATVSNAGGPETEILCGIGSAGLAGTEALVRVAETAGVQGLLLPMPYFFPYDQTDLYAFAAAVAAGTRLKILLYNLPQFTSKLEPNTVCDLIAAVPNIVGVKDSSGSLDIVTALTITQPHACRIMGNDSALAPAMKRELCDGVVSGVACVLPELITALFGATPGSDAFAEHLAHLDEFIEKLNDFPTPWGLKWAAEARDVLRASFSLPVSEQRTQVAHEFVAWLRGWLPGIAHTS